MKSYDTDQQADFDQANRAFDLFTLSERRKALEIFSGLRYPSIVDRFYEAVYRVIHASSAVSRGGQAVKVYCARCDRPQTVDGHVRKCDTCGNLYFQDQPRRTTKPVSDPPQLDLTFTDRMLLAALHIAAE